jgi:ferritin-like metal-binding protein YciE
MSPAEHKIVQYLNEAHATESALVRELQAQIAMTPRGSYREALESHLRETREHAARVTRRLQDLGAGENPLQAAIGLAETTIGQLLALGRTPLALVRGAGGEEKILKNAKDACATEALEIATYEALEDFARAVGDEQTAKLAVSIRADEQRMLERVMREIPKLTEAVLRAELKDSSSYSLSETGAADAVRDAVDAGKRTARRAQGQGRRKARSARKVPARTSSLRSDEPWPGYDELGVSEIRSVLGEADESRAAQVRSYERAHKNRSGVLAATERETAGA